MPLISSSLFLGLISRLKNSLSSCHRFSMGFRSGDSAGVFHQFSCFSPIHALACLDVCFGSLSCIKRNPSGNTSSANGMSVLSRISVYSGAFIMPSNMQIPVAPWRLMPAHTWTFTGCLALHREWMSQLLVHIPLLYMTNHNFFLCIYACTYMLQTNCKALQIQLFYELLHKPWFVAWRFSFFSAAEPSMSLQLNCTFIRPHNIVESLVSVLQGPVEALLLVGFSYQLAV